MTRRQREIDMWRRRIGQEPGPDGSMVGRDPRQMTHAELEALGHRRLSPMGAIRAHCVDCAGGSPHEVRYCTAVCCPSWPFRMGSNPWRPPISDERREALREAGRRLAGRIDPGAPEAGKAAVFEAEAVGPLLDPTPEPPLAESPVPQAAAAPAMRRRDAA